MKLKNDNLIKFDMQLPIFNWFYPLQYEDIIDQPLEQKLATYDTHDSSKVRSRAFYFHIPFCETICSFCPFIRGEFKDIEIIELYTQALLREIEWKAQFKSLTEIPVKSIFFGGGTPSLLSPEQLLRIGHAIHNYYDLSQLQEFSFEMEVKSITREKLAAMKEIGVTHARFGLQTFNQKFRDLFNLTATIDQCREAVVMIRDYLPYTSFDILYAMNGQTQEDFLMDLQQAVALGTPTIDVYPIDNLATQIRLHRACEEAGLQPVSALQRFTQNVLLNAYMRSAGYLPHNGHGYVKVSAEELQKQPIVTDAYSFRYHEYVYGHDDGELIGFGVSAISSLNQFTITNTTSRDKYMRALLKNELWEFTLSQHSRSADASRGIILHLPYHGFVEKARIDWQHVHPDTLEALGELIDAKLIVEKADRYEITQTGWYWYVNLMYYLTPKNEQRLLNKFIAARLKEPGRRVEVSQITLNPALAARR